MTVGLDGTHRDSCVSCFNGTDTALVFDGPPEWAVAGLVVMGVPETDALAIVEKAIDTGAYEVSEDRLELPVKVCGGCAMSGGIDLVPALLPNAPVYPAPAL